MTNTVLVNKQKNILLIGDGISIEDYMIVYETE